MLNENLLLDRWYIGIFLVGFGLWLSLGSRRLADLRRCFRPEERSPDLDAAVARRQAAEAIPLAVWYVPGLFNLVLGIAVLAGALRGTVGYALGTCAFALSLGFAYLRMRNHGARRAAALEPRTWTSVVPAVWYPAAAIMALTPLAFADVPGYLIASVSVCFASVLTVTIAVLSNNMAAIMTGENPEIELRVEHRLRCTRVKTLLVAAMGISLVFVAMNSPYVPPTALHEAVFWFVLAAWCAFALPLIVASIRLPKFR